VTEVTEQWVKQYVDSRLKSSTHEARDHLDGGLSLLKLKTLPLSKIEIGAYSTASTTGNDSVTGVGFKPQLLIAFGGLVTTTTGFQSSWGYTDGTNQGSVGVGYNGSTTAGSQATTANKFFHTLNGAGVAQHSFAIVSFDLDGFTFDRTTNVATAYTMNWIAIA